MKRKIAVAVGTVGRPGLGLKAATEQAAADGALADCVKRDSNGQVIAIGPFSVGPNQTTTCWLPNSIRPAPGNSRNPG
jgi:hypothetical protein